jgi:prevent-host-death family protein
MIRLPASQVRERFAEFLNEVSYGNQRLVLQRHGKDIVAMISAEDLARFEELEDRADLRDMKRVRAEGDNPIPWGEAKAELGLK